jgi:hypothetical protein
VSKTDVAWGLKYQESKGHHFYFISHLKRLQSISGEAFFMQNLTTIDQAGIILIFIKRDEET